QLGRRGTAATRGDALSLPHPDTAPPSEHQPMPREDVIRLTSLASVATPSRIRTIAYWVTTLIIASELALGGGGNILRIDYVRDVFERLGYPIYVAVVIGVPKVPAAVVLVLPRLARLKEWAYAGAV